MSKTAEQIEVERAYERGETVECKPRASDKWRKKVSSSFRWDYLDYRIAPAPAPEPITETQDFIPWSAINERFTHSARTPDGLIFVFASRPEIVTGGFRSSSIAMRIDHILTAKAGSKPWPKSIQKRPAALHPHQEEERERLKLVFQSGEFTFAPCGKATVEDAIETGFLFEFSIPKEAYTTPVEAVKPLILSGCGRQPTPSPKPHGEWMRRVGYKGAAIIL